MNDLPAAETARRLRAMWGYSGLEQDDFLKKVPGASDNMLRRKNATKASPAVLRSAANAIGWSTAFADNGPAAIAPAEETTAARVNTLAEAIISLASGDATAALVAARSAAAQQPHGTAQGADGPDHPKKRPGGAGR